jgi:hypothetical protein
VRRPEQHSEKVAAAIIRDATIGQTAEYGNDFSAAVQGIYFCFFRIA